MLISFDDILAKKKYNIHINIKPEIVKHKSPGSKWLSSDASGLQQANPKYEYSNRTWNKCNNKKDKNNFSYKKQRCNLLKSDNNKKYNKTKTFTIYFPSSITKTFKCS